MPVTLVQMRARELRIPLIDRIRVDEKRDKS